MKKSELFAMILVVLSRITLSLVAVFAASQGQWALAGLIMALAFFSSFHYDDNSPGGTHGAR